MGLLRGLRGPRYRTTVFELAGILVFAGVMAAVGITMNGSSKPVSATAQSPSLQPATAQAPTTTSQPVAPQAPVSTSTHSTTIHSSSQTGGNGSTSTQVTVDGQPVAISDNGSTQQTIISPDGHSTVNVSVGSSNNSSTTITDFSVDNSTQSSVTSGGGQ